MAKQKSQRKVRVTSVNNGKVRARIVPVEGNRFLEAWADVHPPSRKSKRTL